ncbi:MAG: WYL domain-containing protein, partial [Chloroflexi bacterium]|nr:WYL domain-containing protein [Chloroflexota bacterium]
MSRAKRLQEMERLYYQRAFSDIEMAQRMGVDRTVIYRDRRELETEIPFIEESPGKYRIDRRRYLSHIRLDVREALSLYLATRRASQQTRSGQMPMANALEKLSYSLHQPMTERLVKSAEKILTAQIDPEREKVFENVAHAWVDKLRLRIRYQGLSTRKPYRDRISPYLIEPSPWSDSVYVIGPSDVFQDIVTYRLDRILEAYLTTERFEIPDDFDEEDMLRYAWG